jgi:putative transposase
VDQRGRLIAFILTAGQRGDAPVAHELIAMSPAAETLAADRAYDSDALRRQLLARGMRPVIPNAPYRKRLHPFDAEAYKRRNLVERAFCRLKDFRRIATRYDRLATNFLAAVCIAATVSYWL